jgi:predicted ester cyclase
LKKVINNRTELLDEFFLPGSLIAASFKDTVILVRTAFPDVRVTIDHMVGEDNQVVVVFTVAGENSGPFMGKPPTGQSILFTGIHYYQIKNERIHTARYEHDLLGLMEQLGMIPSETAQIFKCRCPTRQAGDGASLQRCA